MFVRLRLWNSRSANVRSLLPELAWCTSTASVLEPSLNADVGTEKVKKSPSVPPASLASVPEVIDTAITGTISRTIITHGSTQMMVTTMLIFGGPALHYFALALTIGILFGIYSSVLVASPLLMWLGVDRAHFVKPLKKAGKDEHEGAVV